MWRIETPKSNGLSSCSLPKKFRGSPFFTSFTTEYSSRRRCGGNHFARDCTEPGGTKSIFLEISSGEKFALGYPVISSLQVIILVQNCAALPLPLLPCWTLASLGFVSSLLRYHDENWYSATIAHWRRKLLRKESLQEQARAEPRSHSPLCGGG